MPVKSKDTVTSLFCCVRGCKLDAVGNVPVPSKLNSLDLVGQHLIKKHIIFASPIASFTPMFYLLAYYYYYYYYYYCSSSSNINA